MTATDENALPRRRPEPDGKPARRAAAAVLDDLAILQRVRDGLRALDTNNPAR
jgi:hypothetical protein